MSEKKLPQVGDVIRSRRFAYGHRWRSGADKDVIYVGRVTKSHLVHVGVDEDERVKRASRTGKMPPKWETKDYGAYDRSRGQAEFVVETARLQGGSSREMYPDGWYVTARRLRADGTYDPEGEAIAFYMTGAFIDMIPPEDVETVRKMRMTFV